MPGKQAVRHRRVSACGIGNIVIKNEQRQRAKYDRLGTDAAADLRLPREERDKQDGLGARPALGPFSFSRARWPSCIRGTRAAVEVFSRPSALAGQTRERAPVAFGFANLMPARRSLLILDRFSRFNRAVSCGVKRTSRKCRFTNFAKPSSSNSSILSIARRVKSRTGDTCSISTLSPRACAARAFIENSAFADLRRLVGWLRSG